MFFREVRAKSSFSKWSILNQVINRKIKPQDRNCPKDDVVKVLHPMCQEIWKTQPWPQDWKSSVFIPIPKKDNAEECSNYHTIVLISHASKVMLKIFQARLQQYVKHEISDVQASFRKGRGTRDQIASIRWIIEKESSRKTSPSAL